MGGPLSLRTVAGMSKSSPTCARPTYDQLGPDPEPLGVRADRLIEAAAVAHSPVHSRLAVAGGLRARIIVARCDLTTLRVPA